MGLLRASCFCSCKGPSLRLPVSHCRGLKLDIQMKPLTPTAAVALRSRLALDSRAAHSHSWLGKQGRSCDARGAISQKSKAQAGAADIAIGVDTEQSMSASSTAGQPSREHGAVQFEICRISGDGSCLFKALAQGLHQLETEALLPERELLRAGFELRRRVCAEMTRRRKEIEPFITGIFEAYVEAMALEGCWGGEPELAIATHCLQRPVVAYKQVRTSLLGERTLQRVSVYGAEDYPENSPVCVLFSGAHYDTLLQVPVAR